MVEVLIRSGRRKRSKRSAHKIANRTMTTKDLFKDPKDVVHCSTVQRHLHKRGLNRRLIRGLFPHFRIHH